MPLPILALLGLGGAALLGVGAHENAKETNAKAQHIVDRAKEIYNESRNALEVTQETTEKSLESLGHFKKSVLDTSFDQFCRVYEKIKHIEIRETDGFNEISNLIIDDESVLQIQEISSIYRSAFSSSVAGAATGAAIALATSGSLPVVAGAITTAGSTFLAGNVGLAATGLAGLSAAITPLATIAAPVLLFSGISADRKADENLEKAKKMCAEADVEIERMETLKTLSVAIDKRACMFENLLRELNSMFNKCVVLMDIVISKRENINKNIKFNTCDLTQEELNLIAVTRALAGAVKSVIDTPILSEKGELTKKSEQVYSETVDLLPALSEQANSVTNIDYDKKIINQTKTLTKLNSKSVHLSKRAGIIITLLLGWLGVHRFMAHKYVTGVIWLLTCGGLYVGWFIDIILVCKGDFKTKEGEFWIS